MTKVIYLLTNTKSKNPRTNRYTKNFECPLQAKEFAESIVEQAIDQGYLYFVHVEDDSRVTAGQQPGNSRRNTKWIK